MSPSKRILTNPRHAAVWAFACCLCLLGPAQANPAHLLPLEVSENPGRISGYVFVPHRLAERPALVVALHGCAQRAADFDDETGWTALAEEVGFILLLPEQSLYNNPARCFNWFNLRDSQRNLGESGSIRHQVEALLARYPLDPRRVFVTGLSAGGAMTSVLLATYPDLFAGGALIAGVPYGCAANALQAMPCMQLGNRLVRGPQAWAALVREAAPPGTRSWPRVAIWHDAGDKVVNPFNATSSMEQWTAVHGIDQVPDLDERVGPHRRWAYMDDQGQPRVELWITGSVGHATAIDGAAGCGRDDPTRRTDFVTDVGLCATRHIARFWGLVD